MSRIAAILSLTNKAAFAEVARYELVHRQVIASEQVVHAAARAKLARAIDKGVQRLLVAGDQGALIVTSATSLSSQSMSRRSPLTSGSTSSCERIWITYTSISRETR